MGAAPRFVKSGLVLGALVATGCSTGEEPTRPRDAASRVDASTPTDAAPTDAGGMDAAPTDGGMDAAPTDGGGSDGAMPDATPFDAPPRDVSFFDVSFVDVSFADVPRPDALPISRDAGPPPSCPTNIVARPTPACGSGTGGACLSCWDDEARCLACINSSDPDPAACTECYLQHMTNCFNAAGCQAWWNCLAACMMSMCGSLWDVACRDTNCAAESAAYNGCKATLPGSSCALLWTLECG
jgi:hypothetical protein